MVSSGPSQDQDQKYKSLVEQAIQKVREEFASGLEELRRQFGLAGKKGEVGPPAASQELFAAVAAIDRSRTQAEILTALLDGCCRFAGRSALFLTRRDGLHGWAGSGFNASSDLVGELVMGYGEGTPWSQVVEGHGGIALSGPECAGLCARIDGSHPTEGILIPLVLRDRLAAAVYADRIDESSTLDPSALKLLTYVAAQAIETLPLRERPATATLRLPQEASHGEPRLELWLGQEAATAAPAPLEPAVQPRVEPPVVAPEPVPARLEATTVEAAPVEGIPKPWEQDEVVEESISVEPQIPETEVISEEPEIEAPASPQDTGELQQVASTDFDMESVEEVEVVPSEPVEEQPTQSFPTGDYATAAPQAPTEAPPAPSIDTQPAAPPRGTATEIIPPEDLEEGPGWAFATSKAPVDSADESLHEEAQRLARLLVTEIKLYNEEEVEEGRRNRNIYQTLREDINRSRQIYEERINEKIRAETDYFHEELVRILAGGDADALGM